MQPKKIHKVVLRKEVFTFHHGGSIDVGLLSENHHSNDLTVGVDLLLNEGVVPFCGLLLTPPR